MIIILVTIATLAAMGAIAIVSCWCVRRGRGTPASKVQQTLPYQTYDNQYPDPVQTANVVVWDSQYPGTANKVPAIGAQPKIIAPWDQSLQLMPAGRYV